MPHGEAAATAERLREAIAATSWNITASLGVSSIGLTGIGVETRELISGLIAAADKAMQEAKRAGGNQIRHSDVPTSRLTRGRYGSLPVVPTC
jgi:GGDEF domain-containing protein